MRTVDVFKYILLSLGLCLVQFVVLNNLNLGAYFQPQILVMIALVLPAKIYKGYLLLIGFGIGLLSDFFLNTFGLSTFAILLFLYFRNYWLPKENNPRPEFNVVPSLNIVFNPKWIVYAMFFTFLYHLVYFILEYAAFKYFFRILLTAVSSSIISLLIQWVVFRLFLKHKYL